jgi:hypothetical protein
LGDGPRLVSKRHAYKADVSNAITARTVNECKSLISAVDFGESNYPRKSSFEFSRQTVQDKEHPKHDCACERLAKEEEP